MSSNTLPVCPKTGSTSPSLTVHLCLHTALLREIGNAPIVHVHRDGEAFEVEFLTLDGHTAALATVPSSQVRPVTGAVITHARDFRRVK